ncbi:TlpA family protein disulfide reductase [Winogradskyella psychrotolerans]|uniref:TlpA family protein disulfide reductase n=1 Tax=Winogradskyella psychrotolerans TaxID=1344585 RepID=UPI001C075626|nr:TlpA disulfide reductase family protein [Winogradskyella psychrotolerans]MBU2927303.1 TlpA family protein disulfide reductase [Winogradskyella psychrotolerans]
MKKINLAAVILLLLLSCKDDKKTELQPIVIGDFSFTSPTIKANEPFKITYNGDGDLDDSFYYQVNHANHYPLDLDFVNNSATITVPDSISVIAFNFKIDETYDDNNADGYLFSVVNNEGQVAKDEDAATEYYAFNTGKNYGITGDAENALITIETAIEKHPELTKDWVNVHFYLTRQVDANQLSNLGEAYLSKYKTEQVKSLEDYEMLSNIYSGLRDSERNDSILNIISEKYPNSNLAFRPIINSYFDAKDLVSKETIFETHKEAIINHSDGKFIIQNIALANYNDGNEDAFHKYLDLMDNEYSKASIYNSIAWPKAEKGEDIEAAMALSKQSLDLVEAEQKALKNKPDYYSPKQYENSLKQTYGMYADTYALLAFKNDDIKEAIKYQSIAVEDDANGEINERYIQFLMADEQYKTVVENAAEFIEEGRSTAKLKSYFLEAVKNEDDTKDADMMLAKLEETAKAAEMEAIKKTMIDKEAPDFTLKNLEGKDVTLSSLKGKTVVLDFWATWCGPCIASFPGMQKAVTKYKDDETIEFLFIDTFEDGKDRIENVSKFIADNNYDFNVLIDPKEENGNHTVVNAYDITGIPTKIIVGPSGRINFISVGFSGSADKEVSKINTMIEILN